MCRPLSLYLTDTDKSDDDDDDNDCTDSPSLLSLPSAHRSGNITLKPGCDALQSLESNVNGILGQIREKCGQAALQTLTHTNSALTMAQSGYVPFD